METQRLPRFRRATIISPIQLTHRDRQIIRLIYRYRFLKSTQILALIGGSSQTLLRRLQLLFHNGYLERPRAQRDYHHEGGFQHIVYGLGDKGAALLEQELGVSFPLLSWSDKNRSVKRMFLRHALLVSDVMVALELACRKANVRLLTEEELGKNNPQLFRWKAELNNKTKLGVIPDRVFALEFQNQNGVSERAFFFLEADRGTMPVIRANLLQTSFFRKLLGYEATWTQSMHKKRFDFHRFRVLTVTTSAARLKSLVEACSQLERGRGLFIFGEQSVLNNPEILFAQIWQTTDRRMDSLLNFH